MTTSDFDSAALFCVSFCQDCRRGERPRQDHQAGLIIRRQYQHESKVPRLDETSQSHPMSQRIRNRFKIRQLREVRKGEKMAEVSPETSNIQRPIPGHFSSFFHVFSTCLDAQFCEGLPGLGWDDQQSGQGLRDTL